MKSIIILLISIFISPIFNKSNRIKRPHREFSKKGDSNREVNNQVSQKSQTSETKFDRIELRHPSISGDVRQIKSLKGILQTIRQWETHSYEDMLWFMQFLNRSCSPYAHLYSIGSSVQNREIWVMAISDNPSQHDISEPEIKIVANIHGNEEIGKEVILHMIDKICSNIESDVELQSLIQNTRIHFLPSINPDGSEMARFHKENGKNIGRLNSNGVDLNRNFPDQFFPSFHDPEPETTALVNWMEEIPFMLSASLHDGAFVVTFPYDDSPSGQTKYSATPDDDIFRYLTRLYSETHPEMHLSNMGNCSRYSQHKKFIGGITNGAEWSSLSNTMQDYNYVRTNCFEITVEMSCTSQINSSNIPTLFQNNYPSLVSFIRQSLRGIKGIVTDEEGKPLSGVHISVSDRKHDVKTAKGGDYWRMLLPGSYEISARLKGYEISSKIVSIPNAVATWANFTLFTTQTDPTIKTLGHVNNIQKSLNLMTFESDGRDATDNEVKDSSDTSSTDSDEEQLLEETRGRRLDDYSEEPSSHNIKQMIIQQQSKYILPVNLEGVVTRKSIEQPTIKVPRPSQQQFKLNDLLLCYIPGRKEPLTGKLKWSGTIPELVNKTLSITNSVILGLDLIKTDNLATDGTFLGKRYFSTKPNRAYFVPNNMCKHR